MASAVLRSLRARLLLALSLPLAALVGVGAYLEYRSSERLALASHDRALAGIAIGLASRLETDRDDDLPAHLLALMRTMTRFNPEDRLFFLVVDAHGGSISGDPALAPLIALGETANPSFVDTAYRQEPVRAAIYHYAGPDGCATVVVAETLNQRTAEVRQAFTGTAATNAVMALAVAFAATIGVGFALRPLAEIGRRIEGHDVRDLRPMRPRRVPAEVEPLVRALNRLIQRLRRTVRARQAFISNTAHQLRTPLAGLTAQSELLRQEHLTPSAAARAQDVAHAAERLTRLVNQLLSLARADEDTSRRLPMETVRLPDVLDDVASACLDAALARGIDLGFEPQAASVQGSPWMLRELLMNLVGNAIAHTPTDSVVTVRCGRDEQHRALIEVEDNGPGIPAPDRERVFDRFVRLSGQDRQGTGLGLAIVREIAQRHRAEVRLLDAANGQGLRVRVMFPA